MSRLPLALQVGDRCFVAVRHASVKVCANRNVPVVSRGGPYAVGSGRTIALPCLYIAEIASVNAASIAARGTCGFCLSMSRRHSCVVVLCLCGGIRRFCRLNLSAVFNICYCGHRKSSLFFNVVNPPRQLLHLAFQYRNAPCEVVMLSDLAGQFLDFGVGDRLRGFYLSLYLFVGIGV